MMLVQIPVTQIVFRLAVLLDLRFQPACCFLRLLIKDGKASADCPLKIRFTPFFPDIIPRTDQLPVVTLHLRHRRTREN